MCEVKGEPLSYESKAIAAPDARLLRRPRTSVLARRIPPWLIVTALLAVVILVALCEYLSDATPTTGWDLE